MKKINSFLQKESLYKILLDSKSIIDAIKHSNMNSLKLKLCTESLLLLIIILFG